MTNNTVSQSKNIDNKSVNKITRYVIRIKQNHYIEIQNRAFKIDQGFNNESNYEGVEIAIGRRTDIFLIAKRLSRNYFIL